MSVIVTDGYRGDQFNFSVGDDNGGDMERDCRNITIFFKITPLPAILQAPPEKREKDAGKMGIAMDHLVRFMSDTEGIKKLLQGDGSSLQQDIGGYSTQVPERKKLELTRINTLRLTSPIYIENFRIVKNQACSFPEKIWTAWPSRMTRSPFSFTRTDPPRAEHWKPTISVFFNFSPQ